MENKETINPADESLFLSQILTDIGLTENNFRFRRMFYDIFGSCIQDDEDDEFKDLFVSGSSSEGVMPLYEMTSDLDIMCVLDTSETNLTLADSHYHPCFTKVCFMNDDGEMTKFVQDILKHTLDNEDEDEYKAHGPAFCCRDNCLWIDKNYLDYDFVFALFSPNWPKAAMEWVSRNRKYNWPPSDFIEYTRQKGHHIVKVGCKGSPEQEKEWRYSFSMAETELVKHFNITQIRCYALMKYILKWLINPVIPDVLCSYHVKTVMFWSIEETDGNFWTEDKVTICLRYCLHRLMKCVRKRECANYFIRTCNLFSTEIPIPSFQKLDFQIQELLREGWKCIFKCTPLSKELLIGCGHTERRCPCFLNLFRKNINKEINFLKMCLCGKINEKLLHLKESVESISNHNLNEQFKRIMNFDHFDAEEICSLKLIGHVTPLKYSVAFGIISTMNIGQKQRYVLQRQLISGLQSYVTADSMCNRLKLANIHYVTGQYHLCKTLCRSALRNCRPNTYFGSSGKLERERSSDIIDNAVPEIIYSNMSVEDCLNYYFVLEVIFTPMESSIVPDAVRKQMAIKKTYDGDDYTGWVFIDPVVYAYYLLINCQYNLGELQSIDTLLEDFEMAVSTKNLFYETTALNLLLACRELRHQTNSRNEPRRHWCPYPPLVSSSSLYLI